MAGIVGGAREVVSAIMFNSFVTGATWHFNPIKPAQTGYLRSLK